VSASLRDNDSFHSNQGEVWDEVENLHKSLSVDESPTGAMRNVYEAKEATINELFIEVSNYISNPNNNSNTNVSQSENDDFDASNEFHTSNQNGVIVFINGELKGMEFLSTEDNYEKYHEKIIKSYSIDALTDIQENIPKIDYKKECNDFINEITNIDYFEKPSVGYGYDCRFFNENIVGAILIHENTVIHGAFFKKQSEEIVDDEQIVSSQERTRFYENY
jgi:hypothetical protein